MAVDSKHPLYTDFLADWRTMRDTYRGQRPVKDAGELYLPATSSMVADGMGTNAPGRKAYDAYRMRALFPSFVRDAVERLVGAMHHKPANIELPRALESLRERATITGESLLTLLRRINEAQLVEGRFGLLAELPEGRIRGADVLPWIATYDALSIVNWDVGTRDDSALVDKLNLVVLEETEHEREAGTFEWVEVQKYRVLVLGDPDENEGEMDAAVYRQASFRGDESGSTHFADSDLITPDLRGEPLGEIPFTFVNAKDVLARPDEPVLLGLADLALAVYRGDADYRQNLFMQGQDTLVTIGSIDDDGEARRVGAGAEIQLPMDGDAKYIGVESSGLAEQAKALQNDKARADMKGGLGIDGRSRAVESGDALRTRVAAQTASLNQVVLAGAGALQEHLRIIARWAGADPEQVIVEPNLDFSDDEAFGRELMELASAMATGKVPLSKRSVHDMLRRHDYTTLTFEEEMDEIRQEREGEPAVPGFAFAEEGDDADDE